jgi:putative phage-type endonuclease
MTQTITPINEADWLAMRKQDVTSTESAALFGMSPYMTRFDLWHRKHSDIAPEFNSNERMKWGNRLEAAIAHGVAEEQGWTIAPLKDYMRLPDERAGSSFDFVITSLGEPVHLEIKNVDYIAFKNGWIEHDDGSIEAPEHIEMQVQHQMMVSGYKRAYIGAFIGGNRGVVIERERDEAVISAMRAAIKEFWRTVDNHEEPPPVMPGDAEVVIRLNQYAQPGKILDATNDVNIAALVAQYKQASDAEANAIEDKEVIKAQLLEAIGDAEKVLIEGWTITAALQAETPPTLITADMVGTSYGGRKGFRNLRVHPKKTK